MLGKKIFAYLFAILILSGLANAATIYGTVYDISLKKANNARVEIDTSPKQFMVAQNGSYSFSVPVGQYTIKSFLMQKSTVVASAQENITIKQDGSYVLDLILFPDVEEGVENISIDFNGDVIQDSKNNNNILFTGFLVLLIVGIAVGALYYFKTRKKESKPEENKNAYRGEDGDLEHLMGIIKKEGGRATQKEIRKQIPLSEAKISLMIAELEHKGVIEKIKKGRGNIIILKRK